MNSPIDSAIVMPDIQSSADLRHIPIQRVGIRGVRHPMLIETADGSAQPTVGTWTLTVALPPEEKGTHMSRFIALLEKHRTTPMTPALFADMARDMLPLLQAERGDISATFPYFINKSAPVSGVQSLLDYEVKWIARAEGERVEFELVVLVPVTSLCPCSKAISQYGAHNQRSHVTVSAVLSAEVSMDAVIRLVEDEGSCELWGLLKRPDEKYVTERAYDNPKFVEDLVRDVAARLKALPGIARFTVEAENFESIHNHSAYAVVEG
ncbi:GTP cyclohydrolase I FolE2 [Bordetella genomosp. 1]|uniref:GTP cyclohydrolase FolE2 n=1 Tax=Bordetella genomosp. 1 TaxID=1395607 RepID=A0A261S6P3_9BORD|nr:GTP cyclohydrolase FolE2 [Bordetella genomosp. 1]MDQ8035759.1 GTP cyclohydrolase FolE2 [Bordetella sp.]OZI32845.1 GTP cyclohydrolase I FolE2 [Bordetella genomosp. 1]OZI65804.1 GTP cyclohydrolase I FolE2 [Bordetella genomosp. 1]